MVLRYVQYYCSVFSLSLRFSFIEFLVQFYLSSSHVDIICFLLYLEYVAYLQTDIFGYMDIPMKRNINTYAHWVLRLSTEHFVPNDKFGIIWPINILLRYPTDVKYWVVVTNVTSSYRCVAFHLKLSAGSGTLIISDLFLRLLGGSIEFDFS